MRTENIKKFLQQDFRINNLYKIKTKDKKTVVFRPNEVQKNISKKIEQTKQEKKPVRLIILKPRQIGCTTYFCIRNFDKAYWNRNQFVAIIAHRSETANTIFSEIIRFAYQNMDKNFYFPAYNESVRQLKWQSIDSQILVTVDSHGLTPNTIHFTEVSRINNAKDLVGESLQSIPIYNSEVILESTGNGTNNFFHDEWVSAVENPESIWQPLFLKWWQMPDYAINLPENFETTPEEKELLAEYKNDGLTLENIAWRRLKIAEMRGDKLDKETGLTGSLLFKQNFPMKPSEAFILKASSAFDLESLSFLLNRAHEPLSLEKKGNGYVKYFEAVESNSEYILSVDPSFGEAGDNSAITVLKRSNRNVVATMVGKFVPKVLSKYVLTLAKYYNFALVVVERNTGHALINDLLNHFGYSNLYYHVEYDETNSKVYRAGFPTTRTTKNLYISSLEDTIYEKFVDNPDQEYILECVNFENDFGRFSAKKGNDDRVISWAIGDYVAKQNKEIYPRTMLEKPEGL